MMANLLIDQFGSERPDAVMLDPGASSCLAGYQTFLACVSHLEFIGYHIDQIQFSRCAKDFRFGGDHCTWVLIASCCPDTPQCFLEDL